MASEATNTKARSAPISSHPVFPAIVALWFAALLGIGSFVLPISLVENIVFASGLAALVPAASPPLGLTAKLILSLTAASVGAVAGFLLARKIASTAGSRTAAMPGRGAARADNVRPLSAREELGIESLDDANGPTSQIEGAPGNAGQRRRALAVTEENTRSEFLDFAPLPGSDSSYGPNGAADEDAVAMAEFDTDEFADGPVLAEPFELDVEAAEELETVDAGDEPAGQAAPHPSGALAFPEPEVAVPLAFDEPMPNAEIAQDTQEIAAAQDEDAQSAVPTAAAAHEPEENLMNRPAFSQPSRTLGERAMDDVSMVQLVERFAAALQSYKQRAVDAAQQPEFPAQPAAPQGADDTPLVPVAFTAPDTGETPAETQPDEVSPEVAAHGLNLPPIPARLRPIDAGYMCDDDEDEDEDEGFPVGAFSLKTEIAARRFDAPKTEVAQPQQVEPAAQNASAAFAAPVDFTGHNPETDNESESNADTDAYSSLLNMKRPLPSGREFVRIDDDAAAGDEDHIPEPVVVFPGQLQRRAAPASDGPTRSPDLSAASAATGDTDTSAEEPRPAARPFDSPVAAEVSVHPGQVRSPTRARADETERALREALEKLQRMSGAA